jgi:hypothetical protein
VQQRREIGGGAAGELALKSYAVEKTAHVLSNVEGITTALSGSWRRAQPKRLRAWLFRLPAKLTTHARKQYVQLQRAEPLRRDLLPALRPVGTGPPLPA